MSSENQDQILIRYDSVATLLYSVRQATGNLRDNTQLEYAVSGTLGPISPDDNGFPLLINVEILEPGVEMLPLARALVQHKFVVQGIDQFEREGKYYLPQGLVSLLITHAYATTRGIILTRGAGTVVENLVLPVTNPDEITKEYLDAETGDVIVERMGSEANADSLTS
jgi:hypothetical protein